MLIVISQCGTSLGLLGRCYSVHDRSCFADDIEIRDCQYRPKSVAKSMFVSPLLSTLNYLLT